MVYSAAMNNQTDRMLVGNSFPFSLIRGRQVVCEEIAVETLREALSARGVSSFWGHENTRAVAESILAVNLRPVRPRPVLSLDGDSLPVLDGMSYSEAYVLSPDYVENFRPAVGEEVAADAIRSWHALRLRWL